MTQEASTDHLTLALNTTLEREFVTPLTAIRGALEILRDFSDLSGEERERFLENALADCARLEKGIEQLADTVYAAGDPEHAQEPSSKQEKTDSEYAERIEFHHDLKIVDVDFSNFVFSSSKIVNDFYDLLDTMIERSGERWYVVVNYHKCSIWPEAWVAFAHRGKKVNVSYSLGTVRYVDTSNTEDAAYLPSDPELFPSREAALAAIEDLRQQGGHS